MTAKLNVFFLARHLCRMFSQLTGTLAPFFKPNVKNLGVTFDSGLKFDVQISSVVRTSFFSTASLGQSEAFSQPL